MDQCARQVSFVCCCVVAGASRRVDTGKARGWLALVAIFTCCPGPPHPKTQHDFTLLLHVDVSLVFSLWCCACLDGRAHHFLSAHFPPSVDVPLVVAQHHLDAREPTRNWSYLTCTCSHWHWIWTRFGEWEGVQLPCTSTPLALYYVLRVEVCPLSF